MNKKNGNKNKILIKVSVRKW